MSAYDSLWDWKRYWLPHASISKTLVSGLLPSNPAHDYSTLEELSDWRLLVLLGEPGSGKSVEIGRERERIKNQLGPGGQAIFLDGRTTVHSEHALYRMWFETKLWKTWQESSDDIWIFFDGFDESVQLISNLSGLIQHELNETIAKDEGRACRIFLRVASRTTVWQPDLGQALYRILYPRRTEDAHRECTFHLAPPRWDDIQTAAESRGIDGIDFRERIKERRIEALALRPAQLEWLLNIFGTGEQLPEDKDELYWEGIRQLCQSSVQSFDSEHLRAVASRVAFVTKFGGAQSIWLDLDRGNVPPGSIPLKNLAGGREHTAQDDLQVTNDVLRSLVKSGLFTNQEPMQAVWAHQTYPEYLAAKYCVDKGLPLSQMTGLITNPLDRSQKVIPSMVEVAAWMASMNTEMLSHILHHDPGALIESDVALVGPEDRERLLRAFLTAMDRGQLVKTRWPGKGQYASLHFPGVGDVLRPFIIRKSLRKETRDTAIDIAVDCRLNELGELLAAIALDKVEPEVLRRSAAWAVTRLENDQARQNLKPLVAVTVDEDPFEELKGCAMRANWPVHLSTGELLEHLKAPKWHGLGAYRLFLSGYFVQNIGDEDLLPTLEWLDQQEDWGERSFDLHELEMLLVRRAFDNFEDAHVLDWIVRRAASNLVKYKPLFGEGANRDFITELLSASDRRQMLIDGLSRITTEGEQLQTVAFSLVELFRYHPAWVSEDFAWMVHRLHETAAGSALEAFWFSILKDTFSVSDLEQTSILFDLYSHERFATQLADFFEPVDLHSPNASRQRKSWYVLTGQSDHDHHPQEPAIDIENYAVEILHRIEGGLPVDWWRIDDLLKVDERGRKFERSWVTDITEHPGWHLCSPHTRRRIIEAASGFLLAHTSDNSLVGTETYFLADHAAYRALDLLLRERPHELDMLSAETWKKLGPLIMSMHPASSGKDVPNQDVFLRRAMEHGFDPAPWLVKMASVGQKDSPYYLSPALNVVVSLSSDDQLEHLAKKLIQPEMPVASLRESIKVLCERGVQTTFASALKVVQELVQKPTGEQAAATLVALLLDFASADNWNELWTLLESNDTLFEKAFLSLSHWHRNASEFSRGLDELPVAMLYLKLAERFPPSEDPNIGEMHVVSQRESLGRWREDLLSSLAMRGTWEAVEQLRCLAGQLPDIEWLPRRSAEAEEEARHRTWQPPSIDHMTRLARSTDARLINSPQQLQDVIIESLARYQAELSAETPAAADLWNALGRPSTFTPKDELHISDSIKRFLDRDLKRSGIIVNREVENRPQNENDIYVQCLDSNAHASITVVCEVKGCWHRDLYTSMSSQLHERYMKQQGLSHGIYVVAFFDGDRWDSIDHAARHKARRHSFEELQSFMAAQATGLSDENFHVTSFVLDYRY